MTAGFHEVRFPQRLSLATSGGPVRRTDVVNLSNGRETRNSRWKDARRSYDAGSGIRSVGDLFEVMEFFEARSGELYGFRFRDPVDWTSSRPGAPVTPLDQVVGIGDGTTRRFQLTKTYGDAGGRSTRAIAKPAVGTVKIAVNGVLLAPPSFSCDPATGVVMFVADAIPRSGMTISAGFEFDVPVRFATDRIDINLSAFNAGRIPSIPLMEILP
ncbi:DUF2460 domain-containing protein [Rhizobium tubonense]|uniref:Glycoside hydrolase family 24 n=1 Tax=Rhizobium tubonense TaxID=484088 RepID=A0A2W4D0U7_9HYPH|nr:DUF2460 domain-containing protein [Rhizobium tubonense]PZM17081.1 glycoside hydrolase family 24 [Rhizobium tubonense]